MIGRRVHWIADHVAVFLAGALAAIYVRRLADEIERTTREARDLAEAAATIFAGGRR